MTNLAGLLEGLYAVHPSGLSEGYVEFYRTASSARSCARFWAQKTRRAFVVKQVRIKKGVRK